MTTRHIAVKIVASALNAFRQTIAFSPANFSGTSPGLIQRAQSRNASTFTKHVGTAAKGAEQCPWKEYAQLMSESGRPLNVQAYYLGDNIDLEKASRVPCLRSKLHKDYLFMILEGHNSNVTCSKVTTEQNLCKAHPAAVVVYSFGGVSCWAASPEQQCQLLEQLVRCCEDKPLPLGRMSREDMQVRVLEPLGSSEGKHNTLKKLEANVATKPEQQRKTGLLTSLKGARRTPKKLQAVQAARVEQQPKAGLLGRSKKQRHRPAVHRRGPQFLEGIQVPKLDHQHMSIIGRVLCQSAALHHYSSVVDVSYRKLRELLDDISEGRGAGLLPSLLRRPPAFSDRALQQMLVDSVTLHAEVHTRLGLLDTPLQAWATDSHYTLYERVRRYFVIAERYSNVKEKLSPVDKTVGFVLEERRTRNSTSIETWIVLLIAVEIVLNVLEMYLAHFKQ